jgi:thiol-disulfide isomerase/thioredoxin
MITAVARLRRVRFAFALALALLVGGLAHAAAGLEAWTDGPTPELRARNLAGDDIRLADFAGRTVIVNFWATWCAPCVAEMPSLQRLRDRLADRNVEVIAVNFEENAARIRPFVERLGVTFPVVRDHDGTLRTAWKVGVFPTSFVVGPDGRIGLVAKGEIDWDAPQVESRIRSLR